MSSTSKHVGIGQTSNREQKTRNKWDVGKITEIYTPLVLLVALELVDPAVDPASSFCTIWVTTSGGARTNALCAIWICERSVFCLLTWKSNVADSYTPFTDCNGGAVWCRSGLYVSAIPIRGSSGNAFPFNSTYLEIVTWRHNKVYSNDFE